MDEQQKVLIVFGPFRSGTSLTAALLDAMGADFGPSRKMNPQPDRFNPTGYFQRQDAIDCNDALLVRHEHTFFDARPCIRKAQGKTGMQIADHLDLAWTKRAEVVALKDPRFSFTWPLWEQAAVFEQADIRLVRVQRSLDAVARSASKHRFVSRYCAHSLDKALDMSRAMHESARIVCEESALPSFTVDYDALISQPEVECANLGRFALGVDRAHVGKAVRLIGKNGAITRHYAKKLLNPRAVLDAALKTATTPRR